MKRKEVEWGCEWIFVGKSFEKCLLYSVLHHLFAKEDFIGFRFLEDKLNVSIKEWQIREEILRKVGEGWTRISGLFVKKSVLRWEKLLKEIVQHMPDELDELIQKMFEKILGDEK